MISFFCFSCLLDLPCHDAAQRPLPDADSRLLDFPASRTIRNKYLLCFNCLVSGVLLQQHKMYYDNTEYAALCLSSFLIFIVIQSCEVMLSTEQFSNCVIFHWTNGPYFSLFFNIGITSTIFTSINNF